MLKINCWDIKNCPDKTLFYPTCSAVDIKMRHNKSFSLKKTIFILNSILYKIKVTKLFKFDGLSLNLMLAHTVKSNVKLWSTELYLI